METAQTSTPARDLPVVGGHLALDFANTVDDPDGPARYDHLGSYPELLQWSVRLGALSSADVRRLRLAADDRPRAAAALRRAHALRAILIDLFTAVAAGDHSATSYWPELRPYLTEALEQADLSPDGSSYALHWSGADRPHAMLWPVARAAADLLTGPELTRVKRCAGCPWLFLDHSKNGSRRWCSMEDCGTNAKMRRYVARRAARRQA